MIKHLTITALLLLTKGLMPGAIASSQEVVITPLEINSPYYSELAPFVQDSVIYFISNRKSAVIKNIFNQHDEHLYKLYKSPLLANGKIGRVSPFNELNAHSLTAGPITFSADGNYMVSTLGTATTLREARLSGAKNQLGLFITETRGEIVGPPNEIPLTRGEYSVGHASLSPDGTQLFFISNRDGGQGETDIYLSRRVGTGWGEPVNLGNIINTPGRELFPFFHHTGRLYFSSDGHGGNGGLDIFYTLWDGYSWSVPTPMASPINSEFDDFSSFINSNGLSGYIASNRGGNDNIYFFEYALTFCTSPAEVAEESFCFTFYEESALENDTIAVEYRWRFSDGHEATGASVDHCLPGPGFFEVKLDVIDAVTGQELYSVARYDLMLEHNKQVYIEVPPIVRENEPVTFSANLTGFGIPGDVTYIWDFGDGKRKKGVTVEHVFRNRGVFQVKCEAYWNGQQICSYRIITVE